ncbi:hypothetical protein Hdeb2414_s0013g00414361 [Helianthus debilis subsp. tardiflorus]
MMITNKQITWISASSFIASSSISSFSSSSTEINRFHCKHEYIHRADNNSDHENIP